MIKRLQKKINTRKLQSTSITCPPGAVPQWTSETQINYMSQFDFISYDLEDDKPELIERPSLPHQIICVKYSALIGHSVVRVIYLHRQKSTKKVVEKSGIKKKTQVLKVKKYGQGNRRERRSTMFNTMQNGDRDEGNDNQKKNMDNKEKGQQQKQKQIENKSIYITIIPSYNMMDSSSTIKIQCAKDEKNSNLAIQQCIDFTYLYDSQSVIVPVVFSNWQWGIIYQNMSPSDYYNQKNPKESQDLGFGINLLGYMMGKNNNSLSFSLLKNNILTFESEEEQYTECRTDTLFKIKKMKEFLKKVSILPCKQPNLFYLVYPGKIELIKISTLSRSLEIVVQHYLSQNQQFKYPLNLALCKSYLIGLSSSKQNTHTDQLKCLILQDERIEQSFTYPLNSHIHKNEQIMGMIGSSNKILIWLKDRPIIHQFIINDLYDKINYVNCVDLSSQKIGNIDLVIASESARNLAILNYANLMNTQKSHNKIMSVERSDCKQDLVVSNFLIFKLELFTQLCINDNSLYLRYLKYITPIRTKCVKKLVLPRLYEQLYALSGSQVHTLDSHKLMGVLSFDIHPYGFFLAVSYTFNIKIYSLEHHSMTLLYNISMHNIKKVLFSPNGANIVLFSPRKIKILDTFSFQVRYEHNEKSTTIINVCFNHKNSNFYVLLESGVIIQKSFLDLEIVKTYRIFAQTTRKIVDFQIEQQNQTLYFRLDDGTLISKNIANLTAPEGIFQYQDGEKISCISVDDRNQLILCGTQSGKIRIHNSMWFKIGQYSQRELGKLEITAIVASSLQNSLYVGNIGGDITTLKIYISSQVLEQQNGLPKTTKNIKYATNPNQSISLMNKLENMQQFSYKLLSAAKFNGNSQQNTLQDKLQSLIDRIHHHTTNFKNKMIENYNSEEQKYSLVFQKQTKQAYREYEYKTNRLKNDLCTVKQRLVIQKKQVTEQYEQKLKQLFKEQEGLTQQKVRVKRQTEQDLKKQRQKSINQLVQLQQQLANKSQMMQNFINEESVHRQFVDLDEDFCVSENDGLKFYKKSLDDELKQLKNKCMKLNKSNGYLETAKKNMLSRKVQEETLEYRIKQELSTLYEIKCQQADRVTTMTKQLKSTEQLIHRIQNKVKNTPNNVISSDKADSDLCSYKIWMKNKVQEEVNRLEQYLADINDKFDKKSQAMVEITTETKRNIQKMQQMHTKKMNLKQKLKQIRLYMNCRKNHQDNQKRINQGNTVKEGYNEIEAYKTAEFQKEKVKKIVSMERINDKAIYFQNKNLKIHARKIKNLGSNCTELLKQYEKLKYENKDLIDKQKKCMTQIHKLEDQLFIQNNHKNKGIMSERGSHENCGKMMRQRWKETPFQSYVRIKAARNSNPDREKTLMMKTAISSPRGANFISLKTSRIR